LFRLGKQLIRSLSIKNKNSEKFKLAYLVAALASGNLVATTIKVISGFLVAVVVEPKILGLFNGIGLVLGYAPFLHLGVANGLNRELPICIGRNQKERAEELASTAQAWLIWIGIICCSFLVVVATYQLYKGNLLNAAGWLTNAVMAFFLFYNTSYLQVTYRTAQDFARLSIINVLQNITSLVLILFVWLLNFYGLCLRSILTAIVTFFFLYKWKPISVKPHLDRNNLIHLIKIGSPIFVVGQIYAWWTVLNQTLVLFYTGSKGMGLYAMVTMTIGTVALIPQALIEVTYPRMAEEYGKSGNAISVAKMTFWPMFASLILMIPIIFICLQVIEPLTRYFLPKYIDAVPAMKWSLLQPLLMCLAPINNLFNIIRRQGKYLLNILTGMFTYIFCLLWLIKDEIQLEEFPKAMAAGYLMFLLTSYGTLFFILRKTRSA
jgi:O-antigen/teichoic acid export membrane protein